LFLEINVVGLDEAAMRTPGMSGHRTPSGDLD
jgi:hypothetical protein